MTALRATPFRPTVPPPPPIKLPPAPLPAKPLPTMGAEYAFNEALRYYGVADRKSIFGNIMSQRQEPKVFLRELIWVRMRSRGLSYLDISRACGVGHPTIVEAIKRHRKRGESL